MIEVNQIITLLAFSSCNLYFMNFPLPHKYFPLHVNWPIIHVIFSSRRIIIDIIVYERKIKTCINVLLSFSIHILSFAHTLIYNLHYFSFERIIIDIIIYGRKRKTCIIDSFGRILIDIIVLWKEKKMCIIFAKK